MASIARHHFPRFVWQNGAKLLWNPVQKKAYKNRPEERVRLRMVEAMVAAGWSKNRISVEESIAAGRSADKNSGGRTDIICYDRDFSPKILVECKAENVPISAKVAEQTARYNRSVDAPFLLMSNGLEDFWYRIRQRHSDQKMVEWLNGVPDLLDIPASQPRREFSYWNERGFAGGKAAPGLQEWLADLLHSFWFKTEGEIRFLSFSNTPSDLHLAHYFKIFELEEGRVAVGFTDTPTGESRLIGVFNRQQQNIGMIALRLDDFFAGKQPDTAIFSTMGARVVDLPDESAGQLSRPANQTAAELPALLDRLFRKLE